MKNLFLLVSAFVLGFCSPLLSLAQEVIDGEYLVQVHPHRALSRTTAQSKFEMVEKSLSASLFRSKVAARTQSSGSSPIAPYDPAKEQEDCAEILKDPAVTYCEANYVKYNGAFPNDPLFYQPSPSTPLQFYHFSDLTNGSTFFDTRAPFGWDRETGSKDTVIAIIDSGANYRHPDLINNLWINPGELVEGRIVDDGVDNDGNGFIDDFFGIDATNLTNNPDDCNGHGSHVAGLAGAKGNNGIGVSGSSWDVSMILIRNAVDCGPSVSTMSVLRGMDYLYDLKTRRGIDVTAVNASYTGPNFSQAEYAAMQRLKSADILFLAAAGNGGEDGIGDNIDVSPQYPAAYDVDNIIAVANFDTRQGPNKIAVSSNFGTTSVDIAAPGSRMLSTIHQVTDFENEFNFNNAPYGYKSGTSMATPVVTGAVALLKSQRPKIHHYSQLKAMLLGTAFQIPALQGKVNSGLLDIASLLAQADPQDLCPNSDKFHPGHCGCDQPENYTNSDSDMVPDCADQCPTDSAKTSPGACGCGVADTDTNGNGIVDCTDLQIQSVTPGKPRVKRSKRKLKFTLDDLYPGSGYLITMTTTFKKKVRGKKKKKTVTREKLVRRTSPTFSLKKPKRGKTLKMHYAFELPGGSPFVSQNSPEVKFRGKK